MNQIASSPGAKFDMFAVVLEPWCPGYQKKKKKKKKIKKEGGGGRRDKRLQGNLCGVGGRGLKAFWAF